MKKHFLLIIFIMLLFPCLVNAKEYCKIVSGDGKSIGTEIQCGTENFYIVENKNNTINMLSKYNLLVGDKIDYFEAEDDAYYPYSTYCYEKVEEKGYNSYDVYSVYDYSNGSIDSFIGCRVYERLNPTHIRQDAKAIGPKLDENGKTIFPLYGITYMNPNWGYEARVEGIRNNHEYDSNENLIVEGTIFEEYLNGYKTELLSQNIEVSNVSFITLDKTLKLLKDISGKDINIDLEYEEFNVNDPTFDPLYSHIGQMDIKEFVPNNHKWVHSISYWLGSGFMKPDDLTNTYNDYFIADVGLLCTLGRGECSAFDYPVGIGIRPLVTISTSNIEYLIRTKTDGHGTIEVIDHSPGGESIKFRVNSNKGYELDSVTIITDSGEKVNFKKGEIQKNKDGTMSIDKNNFTMPFENVTIEARWKSNILNPNTGVETLLIIGLIVLSTVTMTVIIRRKNKEEEIEII